jgi:hypothetical protein
MASLSPLHPKDWYDALARNARVMAEGCVDEQAKAALLAIAESYALLADLQKDACFCGGIATFYRNENGEKRALCDRHAVLWETEHREPPPAR